MKIWWRTPLVSIISHCGPKDVIFTRGLVDVYPFLKISNTFLPDNSIGVRRERLQGERYLRKSHVFQSINIWEMGIFSPWILKGSCHCQWLSEWLRTSPPGCPQISTTVPMLHLHFHFMFASLISFPTALIISLFSGYSSHEMRPQFFLHSHLHLHFGHLADAFIQSDLQ